VPCRSDTYYRVVIFQGSLVQRDNCFVLQSLLIHLTRRDSGALRRSIRKHLPAVDVDGHLIRFVHVLYRIGICWLLNDQFKYLGYSQHEKGESRCKIGDLHFKDTNIGVSLLNAMK
jgi:hypothetical protein